MQTKRVYREAEIPDPNPTGLDKAPDVNNPRGDVPGQGKFEKFQEEYGRFKTDVETKHKKFEERLGGLERKFHEKFHEEEEEEEKALEEDAEGAGEEKDPEHGPGPDKPRTFPEKKKKLSESLTGRKTIVGGSTFKDKLDVKDAVKEFLK